MPGGQALQLSAGQPRTLAYAHGIRRDLRLLECDEDLLQELLRDGLCLKGGADEEAVLCSGSKTYAVKNVETTNLVLLVQQEEPGPAAAGAAAGTQPLSSQDANVAPSPQPTPPGQLNGLATQLAKNAAAAAQAPVVACAIASSHLELVPAAPKLHQLDELLAGAVFGAGGDHPEEQAADEEEMGGRGVTDSMQQDGFLLGSSGGGGGFGDLGSSGGGGSGRGGFGKGFTKEELLELVQCSAGELSAALRERTALCLDGRYCSVDEGYQGMLLELVLLTAVEKGWPLAQLPGRAVAAALEPHGYDPRVTLHCLATFGSPVGGTGGTAGAAADGGEEACAMDTEEAHAEEGREAAGGQFFCLDEPAVCLHFARSLLQARPDWELEEFESAWQRAVPEGMLPSLDMLRGEALLHGGGTGPHGVPAPRRIKHFPLAALPADAGARFAALFAERPRWEWDDLAPYVQSLRGPGQTAEALLLKYARASQQRPTDPVTYSRR